MKIATVGDNGKSDGRVYVQFDLESDSAKIDRVELEFPAWVPVPVVQTAIALWSVDAERPPLYARDTEIQQIVLRLARDPRMLRVWDELGKKNYGVSVPDAWSLWLRRAKLMPDEHGPQTPDDVGLAVFFKEAVLVRLDVSLLLVAAKGVALGEAIVKEPASDGESLRVMAQIRDALDGKASPTGTPLRKLLDENLKVMQRDRGNVEAFNYVLRLAPTTKRLFGWVMHTSLATTANVAFDLSGEDQISRDNVRGWVRGD